MDETSLMSSSAIELWIIATAQSDNEGVINCWLGYHEKKGKKSLHKKFT